MWMPCCPPKKVPLFRRKPMILVVQALVAAGEYADRIDNADDLLEHFIDAFPEEPIVVRVMLRLPSAALACAAPGKPA